MSSIKVGDKVRCGGDKWIVTKVFSAYDTCAIASMTTLRIPIVVPTKEVYVITDKLPLHVSQVWEEMGKFFADENMEEVQKTGLYATREFYHGLCEVLLRLWDEGKVSDKDRSFIYSVIHDLPDHNNWGYKWLRTMEGARMRREFCREQADKCRQ